MFVLYLPVSRRLDMCVPPRRLRSTGPAVSKHGARDRKQEPAHIYFTSDGVDPRSLDVRTHLMDAKGVSPKLSTACDLGVLVAALEAAAALAVVMSEVANTNKHNLVICDDDLGEPPANTSNTRLFSKG
eukprot:1187688-Prorocentrum_minimum.AAC.1